jgi:hypothetical protein
MRRRFGIEHISPPPFFAAFCNRLVPHLHQNMARGSGRLFRAVK